ncbi:MAG TPA: flagellar biosynthetic protein FliR [Tepidisphaeraceae bacterium]|jgi:flagellar biosynthetic protein FliR|nr:flagellar biosynthetic protein FliR [Tepidisphaeraceae bacterium]
MSFDQVIQDLAAELQSVAPGFALVFIRVSAMMIFAPLLGSAKIPKRVKMLMALVLSLGIASGIPMPKVMPQTTWGLTLGIGGEVCFGIAIGTILSFVFIATQWGGQMIGQQMGLNISEVIDPQFGQSSSVIGDGYFWMTLVIFLSVGGHHILLLGVRESFDKLPLLSVEINRPLFDLLVGLFTTATSLAVQLAAPMLVTMLVVDLSLGCISKTMPQLNVMSAGLTIRSLVGMLVVIVGLMMTGKVLTSAVLESMNTVSQQYNGLGAH